ncbi:AAA family ATPase [Candidatus Uabimicrobium amorphum]|uniref:ATPase n=1 Tax=Uabimicrobium amorphum TaxID=2596890 RepID=A0A5S9IQ05_UABAM|nr:AAA family ATPase [Candidatus Uabimicrobium amorphum]BBM85784.1 ATPase [Candidatus Uabimicrobium amorphum]
MSHKIYRRNFIVISGCSGGGKSTLLYALQQQGFSVINEPGRFIVKQQINTSAVPWINIHEFLHLTLEKSISDFSSTSPHKLTFFDRSIIDTIHPQSPNLNKFNNAAQKYRYCPTIFIVPPWREIFVNDAERRHSFSQAQKEYNRLVDLYHKYHYTMISIPKVSVDGRVRFVLERLEEMRISL